MPFLFKKKTCLCLCRKLKNRVAAQTARDRKKQRMDELEDMVAALEDENLRLQSENLSLKSKTGTLSQENTSLRQKLGLNAQGVPIKVESKPESAALAVPQQKERALTLSQLKTPLPAWILTLRCVDIYLFSGMDISDILYISLFAKINYHK